MLPLYLKEAGGSTFFAGLIFGAFSVMSFVVRPFIGKLTDTWSISGVLMIGSLILGMSGLTFLIPAIWLAFIVNTVRGIGWAAVNTAGSTAIAVAAPPSRRAEASGTYSVATTVGASAAPALALALHGATGGFGLPFVFAGLFGLAGAVVVYLLPPLGAEATRGRGPFSVRGSGFSFDAFIDRRVLLASLLLLSTTTTSPVIIAFMPVHALAIGVDNIGIYFVVNGAVAIVCRLLLGRFLDRGSRGVWIALGLALSALAFVLLALASGIGWFVASAVVNAFGMSLALPSLMAVAMDRADPAHMGRAMATYSMFYRAGEAIGAPLAGALVDAFGFGGMYVGAIVSLVVGLLATVLNWQAVNATSRR